MFWDRKYLLRDDVSDLAQRPLAVRLQREILARLCLGRSCVVEVVTALRCQHAHTAKNN